MFFRQIPGDDLPTPPSGWFYLEPEFAERSLGGLSFPGTVVPEPSTLVLALSGLVAAAARGRRGRPRRPNQIVGRRSVLAAPEEQFSRSKRSLTRLRALSGSTEASAGDVPTIAWSAGSWRAEEWREVLGRYVVQGTDRHEARGGPPDV